MKIACIGLCTTAWSLQCIWFNSDKWWQTHGWCETHTHTHFDRRSKLKDKKKLFAYSSKTCIFYHDCAHFDARSVKTTISTSPFLILHSNSIVAISYLKTVCFWVQFRLCRLYGIKVNSVDVRAENNWMIDNTQKPLTVFLGFLFLFCTNECTRKGDINRNKSYARK